MPLAPTTVVGVTATVGKAFTVAVTTLLLTDTPLVATLL